tara:strand:+ start:153 stop:959 length:807 start_codon:yes stop_codon:yes gene_type:complete
MFKDLCIGGTAACIARTCTAPLELYKIQCQNRYLPDATLSKVWKKEGFRYFWKGNGMNCARAFPQFGINYCAFQFAKHNICNNVKSETQKNFYSGGISGLVAMSIIYPLETIRTRLSLQLCHSHYQNPFHVVKALTYKELYGGLGISLLGFGPFSAFNYMFYYNYKKLFEKQQFSKNNVHLLAGGLSGMSAICLTYPSDLLRRRFQMQGFSKEVPKYTGIYNSMKTIVKEEGVRGLYRGLGPACIRNFPCLAIQFWCFEKGKELLGND